MRTKIHTNPDGSTVEIPASASVGEGASVGARASVGEGASVGEWARVGEGAIVGARARVGARASVGEGARVGEGASVGEWAVVAPCACRSARRPDGYVFTVATRDGEPRVFAGCRDFNEREARAHWNPEHRHHAETVAILDFLFR